MAITFAGQLNPNEIYTAFSNMIISQRLYDIEVAEPTLADRLSTDGGMYGDKKLFYSSDIIGTRPWGNDAEAPNLLTLYRNKRQNVQEVNIDQFRIAQITVDNYMTKRAWLDEGSFAQFNSILVAQTSQAKRVYENGYVNTYIGTHLSTAPRANQVPEEFVDISGITGAADREAQSRLNGQSVSKLVKDIYTELRDNRRDYNELGYMRAHNPEDLLVVWNAQELHRITDIDLPTVFHMDRVMPMSSIEVDKHYFGRILTAAGTADGANVYTLVEGDFTGTAGGAQHKTIGELLPAGAPYAANEAYSRFAVAEDIIFKMISVEGNPFMSGFSVGTTFNNPFSLTDTHAVIWSFNTMQTISYTPFVTVAKNASAFAAPAEP